MSLPLRVSKRFKPDDAAPTQQAIIALLDASPLPWTITMLNDWFGKQVGFCAKVASETCRIWRIERGMYTANRHYVAQEVIRIVRPPEEKVIVTDEMLKRRFGFNL